jgi:hypothetical protein
MHHSTSWIFSALLPAVAVAAAFVAPSSPIRSSGGNANDAPLFASSLPLVPAIEAHQLPHHRRRRGTITDATGYPVAAFLGALRVSAAASVAGHPPLAVDRCVRGGGGGGELRVASTVWRARPPLLPGSAARRLRRAASGRNVVVVVVVVRTVLHRREADVRRNGVDGRSAAARPILPRTDRNAGSTSTS